MLLFVGVLVGHLAHLLKQLDILLEAWILKHEDIFLHQGNAQGAVRLNDFLKLKQIFLGIVAHLTKFRITLFRAIV